MNDKVCDFNHLLLYAKHHYKRGDLMQDMQRILSHRCGVESMDEAGVWCLLVCALLEYRPQRAGELLFSLFNTRSGEDEIPFLHFVDNCPLERAMRNILNELRYVRILGRDGVVIHNIGKPDPAILPLAYEGKDHEQEEKEEQVADAR